VAEDPELERARADGKIVLLAARSIALGAGSRPAPFELTAQVGAVGSPVACPSPAGGAAAAGAHARSTWAPVFSSRFIRTPYELRVRDDDDASAQLELLAAAVGLDRDRITIKPPPGWRRYGHPALYPP
jgi:hypothetical protein